MTDNVTVIEPAEFYHRVDIFEEESEPNRVWCYKIAKILMIYPKISPSMLQISLGGAVPPAVWKPIAYRLIKKGALIEQHISGLSITGRNHTHTIWSLSLDVMDEMTTGIKRYEVKDDV